MNDSRIGIYEKALPAALTWRERLDAAKRAGFDFLELSIDESQARLDRLELGSGTVEELRSAMRDTGPSHPDNVPERTPQNTRLAAGMAKQGGAA